MKNRINLILRDLIACMQKIFNDDLENDGFLHKCIFTNQEIEVLDVTLAAR